jgi:hypothetical protein
MNHIEISPDYDDGLSSSTYPNNSSHLGRERVQNKRQIMHAKTLISPRHNIGCLLQKYFNLSKAMQQTLRRILILRNKFPRGTRRPFLLDPHPLLPFRPVQYPTV